MGEAPEVGASRGRFGPYVARPPHSPGGPTGREALGLSTADALALIRYQVEHPIQP